MNRIYRAVAATGLSLALLLAPAAQAQTPAASAAAAQRRADPALWVVKDKDTTVYLFGTFHLLPPGYGWFDGGVKKAFDSSSELVTEAIEPDAKTLQPLMMRLAINRDGPPLTQKLSPKAQADYRKAMTELELPIDMFEPFDPWAAALNIQVALFEKMGFGPDSGAETVLEAAAKASGKARQELEGAELQIRIFDAMPERAQIALLESTVQSIPEQRAVLNRMLASWAAGDAKTLSTLMNQSLEETPELYKIMVTDRNARWAQWIERRMQQPGTVFVAVGAAHLAGTGSVQDYLKARKLRAKRVKY
ncbi:TraB/GumN family protein [Sphingomonas sanxanigenens]|uniref:TraB/GumN family protein n=1 Tax=Sphingomonas sanxanigenens DSM 19645 = NX02 TaxID=1123269 RepID=W0AEJ0_9SPHN|nr:TraB/GumN family protein [Sphingomonas sanxanigenens]AHE54957.1 hypothetical protein NX02_16390 [Sphingomonas sanxanigenens DSM 19645 = NX02]